MSGQKREKYNYVFKMLHDGLGRIVVQELREALNRQGYRMRLRGSRLDRAKAQQDGKTLADCRHMQRVGSIPLKYADDIRIYISKKG